MTGRRSLVGAAVLVVVLGLGWWFFFGRVTPVVLPPPTASAETVATTYGSALAGRDCNAVVRMSTDAYAVEARRLCDGRAIASATVATEGDPSVGRDAMHAQLGLHLVTRSREGFPDGRTFWFLPMVKDPTRGWLVDGGGTGP